MSLAPALSTGCAIPNLFERWEQTSRRQPHTRVRHVPDSSLSDVIADPHWTRLTDPYNGMRAFVGSGTTTEHCQHQDLIGNRLLYSNDVYLTLPIATHVEVAPADFMDWAITPLQFKLATATALCANYQILDGLNFDDPVMPPAGETVGLVNRLTEQLGIPNKTLFTITGISKSSFNNWSNGRGTPRASSEGRLWELSELVDDLCTVLDQPIRTWLRVDPTRMDLLRGGEFDELFSAALSEQPNTASNPPAGMSRAVFAVGGDHDEIEDDRAPEGPLVIREAKRPQRATKLKR